MNVMNDRDLAALNAATCVRLLDEQHRVIGEAQLGQFSLHGDAASSSLAAGIKLDSEPCFVELLDGDGRVVFGGEVAAPALDVAAIAETLRRILRGEE